MPWVTLEGWHDPEAPRCLSERRVVLRHWGMPPEDEPLERRARTHAERLAFVREHTASRPVPLVPEISVRVASEVTPLWHATEAWLASRGIDPPFWAFPWAGGQVLARYLLDTPEEVRELRVLDFASGSGLVAIAAARAGAREVVAVDIDPLAIAATELNAEASGVSVEARAEDVTGHGLADRFDVVLAGDVFYDAGAAARFLPWFRELAAAGVRVLVGDPGRTYVPTRGVSCLFRADVPVPLGLESRETLASRVLSVEPMGDVRPTS